MPKDTSPSTITVKDALAMWCKSHPGNEVTRQTIVNWSRRFHLVHNTDRIVKRSKIILDSKKFNEFNSKPKNFLDAK